MKSQDNKGVAGGIIFGVCLLIIGFTLHENSALFIIGGLAMIGGMVLVLSCSSKDEEKELYRWNAHKGDSNAQFNLGLHFYEGY